MGSDVFPYTNKFTFPFFRYTHIKHCLHKAPVGIEERGSDWPEEWPKRLESYPEWLGDLQTRVATDHNHWKAVVEKSYLDGLGIDWSNIRNVMDMRAVYGGYKSSILILKLLDRITLNNMHCTLNTRIETSDDYFVADLQLHWHLKRFGS